MIQMMGPPLRALFDIHNLQHNTPPNDIYLLEYDRSIRNDNNFRRSVGTKNSVSRDWTVRRRSVEVPYPGLSVRPSWRGISSGSFFSLRTSAFQVEPAAAKIRTRRFGYFLLDSFVLFVLTTRSRYSVATQNI